MKVVYFDYWTGGIHNFKAIDESLKSLNHQTMLLHIGSMRFPHPAEEDIEGIHCRDISYYKTKFIYHALKKIQPEVVVTLNTTYIMDRALILACRRLSIKTVFMMHGIKPTGKALNQAIGSMEGRMNSLTAKLKKGGKYFSNIIPNYVRSVIAYKPLYAFKFTVLTTLLHTFSNPAKAMYFPNNRAEIIQDKCCIYAKKYFEYYRQLGYEEEQIKVVGNPNLDSLFEAINKNKFSINILPKEVQRLVENNQKYAVFLEDGFPAQGMGGWNYINLKEHLVELANKLQDNQTKLVVKLHPSSSISDLGLNHSNALVYKKTDLNTLVHYSNFCIGNISTTMNLPILMYKPIIVPRYNELTRSIADYFVGNEVANPLNSLEDKLDLNINDQARALYKENNISVLDSIAQQNIISVITAG